VSVALVTGAGLADGSSKEGSGREMDGEGRQWVWFLGRLEYRCCCFFCAENGGYRDEKASIAMVEGCMEGR
jgi:hypothetical protein